VRVVRLFFYVSWAEKASLREKSQSSSSKHDVSETGVCFLVSGTARMVFLGAKQITEKKEAGWQRREQGLWLLL
jgi:hypothetical protein